MKVKMKMKMKMAMVVIVFMIDGSTVPLRLSDSCAGAHKSDTLDREGF
jgi:hypothetical protein